MDTDKSVLHPNEKRHSQIHVRSCKSCNSEEAKPPNPRYQVEPGNEILEPLALVENGARAEIHRKFPISISKVHKLILLTL
jgi:hypothetical protein